MKQLLQDEKILGFMIGDERVDKHMPIPDWETMIHTVRNSFPRGTAIIYANDFVCGDSTHRNQTLEGRRRRKDPPPPPPNCLSSIPPALDWISSDKYRQDTASGFIGKIKQMYQRAIYPKLQDHQKVAVIPGVGHPIDNFKICDDSCTAQIELQDAKDTVAWAQSDSRVALVAPYRWSATGSETGLKQLSDADDLRNYWQNFGKGTKRI